LDGCNRQWSFAGPSSEANMASFAVIRKCNSYRAVGGVDVSMQLFGPNCGRTFRFFKYLNSLKYTSKWHF
jgi:hypothetical protein